MNKINGSFILNSFMIDLPVSSIDVTCEVVWLYISDNATQLDLAS